MAASGCLGGGGGCGCGVVVNSKCAKNHCETSGKCKTGYSISSSAAGTVLTWRWSVVCTGCTVHRVHWSVHNTTTVREQ